MEKSGADGVEMDGEETETGGGEVGATDVVVVDGGGGDIPFVSSAGISIASVACSSAPSASSSSRSGGGGDSSLRGVDCREDDGPAVGSTVSAAAGGSTFPSRSSSSSSSSRCGISIGASFSSARGLVVGVGTGDSDELRSSSRVGVAVDSPGLSSSTMGAMSDNGLTMASDRKSASSQESRSAVVCFRWWWWSTRIMARAPAGKISAGLSGCLPT